jgi:chorismate lyase/3-hydroxybenzoate synthase
VSDSNHIRSRNTAVANPENTAPEYLPAPVRCEYIPSSQLADRLHHAHSHVLAVISYGTDIRAEVNLPCPVVTVDTVQFGNVSQTEIWTSPTPVYSARNNCIQFSANGEVLFGYIRLPEPKGWSLDATSHGAYRRILDLIQNEGYPHLMRVWNYLRDINQFANELERYQLFCLGRHRAFSDSNSFFERDLPAASAIGTRYGDSLIYFLAAKQAGMQIENPRQISAFHYPPCYGPRSPSFSRALLKEWRDEHHLYIAGTASMQGAPEVFAWSR